MCENNELNVTSSQNATLNAVGGDYVAAKSGLILKLTVSDGNISTLPSDISEFFPNLYHLIVVKCQLKTLRRMNFVGMEMVKYLNLQQNLIFSLPDDVFEDLLNLRKIDLSDNLIVHLPSSLCVSMYFLTVFTANDNFIELFDSDMFQYNRKLEEVHLWQNKVKAIRFDARKMRSLTVFDVRGNVCIDELFYIPGDVSSTGVQTKIILKCSSYVKYHGQLVYRNSRAYLKN